MLNKLKNIWEYILGHLKLSSLFSIYLLILFVTLFIFCINSVMLVNVTHTYEDYTDGWVTTNGEVIDLENITTSVTVSKVVPSVDKNTSIFFRVKNLNVKVYIDGILYKDYGAELLVNEQYYKTPGTYYVTIPIKESDVGKSICLQIDCPYKNDSSCNITQMRIGDTVDIIRDELSTKIFGFGICIVLIILGLCFIIIIIPMYKYDALEMGHNLLYLGLFSLFIGLWSLTETKMLQLLTVQSVFVHYLNNLSLMIAIIPLFIFFSRRHTVTKYNNGITKIVAILFIVSFLTSVILHYTGLYDLHETIKLTQTCLVVSVLFTFYYAYCCFIQTQKRDIAFIGLFVIAFCSGLDMFFYYKQLTRDNSSLVRIGVLGYVIVLGVQIIAEFARVYKSSLKADDWRRLAITDSLTGLYNRMAFTEQLQAIDNEKTHDDCIIVVFDLNDLKHINDTYGHSFGDMAIIEAAEKIKVNFEDKGKCYRIGGDEFVCIFDEVISISEIDCVCAKFLNDIKLSNNRRKTKRKYELGVALGYAKINHIKGITGKIAFDTADTEMYSKKQELKQEIK